MIFMVLSQNDVECVCLLSNKNAKWKEYVEIGVDADDYYKIKDDSE